MLKLTKLSRNKLTDAPTSEAQGQAQSTSGHIQMTNDGYVKYNVPDGEEDEAGYQDINTVRSRVKDAVILDGSEATGAVEESVYASKILKGNANTQDDISPY